MKKSIIILLACMIASVSLFSQDMSPITVEKKGLSRQYLQNDKRLERKELRTILSSYPGSAKEFKAASRASSAGTLLIGGGALVIGASSLYDSIKDLNALNSGSLDVGHTSVVPFLIGCGMVIGGIPLAIIGNSQFIKSLNLYNSQFKTSDNPVATIQFSVTPVSAGMKITF